MFNPYGNAYMPYQYAPQSPQGIAGVRFVNGIDEVKNCLVSPYGYGVVPQFATNPCASGVTF